MAVRGLLLKCTALPELRDIGLKIALVAESRLDEAFSTPQVAFERLHKAADGRGERGSVRNSDLQQLLLDHSKALAALKDDPGAIIIENALAQRH